MLKLVPLGGEEDAALVASAGLRARGPRRAGGRVKRLVLWLCAGVLMGWYARGLVQSIDDVLALWLPGDGD
jgi:hypothetical protein